jgi:6-phosphogluconolactonase
MRPEPEVVVEASAQTLAGNTAARVLATLNSALRVRDVAHLVVTGGGILEAVLGELAAPVGRDGLEWDRVHVWWGDERFVPADSDERNDKPAFAKLFDHVDVDPAKVHRMPAAGDQYPDAEAAAEAYASELAQFADDDAVRGGVPPFDVILLGVGPEGHCASLFPEHPAVYEEDATVVAVHNSPKPPPTRLSLTFPALDAAAEVWFVTSGDGKSDAVALALSGAGRIQVPAAGPRGRQRTLWLVDRDAAAKLPPTVTRLPIS